MAQNYLFDTVNEFDIVVGTTTLSKIYLHNNYRVINAFVINSFGQLWIPRRSARKIIFPLCLDSSVGGHVMAGENYEEAFHREVKEELNLSTKDIPYKCIGYLTPPRHGVSAFMKVFELRTDIFPEYNSDEIASAQWLYPNEVLNSIHNGDGAKSDLEILIERFYIQASKDNLQNCRVYDLSNELPPARSNNNWVHKYCIEWQKIKDVDHRERIKYLHPVAWAEYYSQKTEIAFGGYRNYHTRRMIENYPFYDLVLKELNDSKIALEIGLGAGTGLIELYKQGMRVVGLDKDQDILKLVDRHSDLDSTGLAHSLVRADLFSLPFSDKEFDVCYSHGVFEHFSDHLIVSAVK